METVDSRANKQLFVRNTTDAEIGSEIKGKRLLGWFLLGLAVVMAMISYGMWSGRSSSNLGDMSTAIFVAFGSISFFWRSLSYLLSRYTAEPVPVTLEITDRSITYNGNRVPWIVVSSIKLVTPPSGGTNLMLFTKNENDTGPDKPRAVIPGINLYEQPDEILKLVQEKAKQPIMREIASGF